MQGNLTGNGKQAYNIVATLNGQTWKIATVLIFEDNEPTIEPTFNFSWVIIEAVKNGGVLKAEKIWSNKAGKNL